MGSYVAAGFGVRGNDVVSSFAAGKARKAAPGIKHTATTAMPGLRMEAVARGRVGFHPRPWELPLSCPGTEAQGWERPGLPAKGEGKCWEGEDSLFPD